MTINKICDDCNILMILSNKQHQKIRCKDCQRKRTNKNTRESRIKVISPKFKYINCVDCNLNIKIKFKSQVQIRCILCQKKYSNARNNEMRAKNLHRREYEVEWKRKWYTNLSPEDKKKYYKNRTSKCNFKAKKKAHDKKYNKNNMDKIKKQRVEKYNSDPSHRLTVNCRNRINMFLKQKGYNKNKSTFKMIGCTPQELLIHIENQFTQDMTLEKLGSQIHIDHIIPLASATCEEDIIKLCHYTNLQPLWAKDNLSKGAK